MEYLNTRVDDGHLYAGARNRISLTINIRPSRQHVDIFARRAEKLLRRVRLRNVLTDVEHIPLCKWIAQIVELWKIRVVRNRHRLILERRGIDRLTGGTGRSGKR